MKPLHIMDTTLRDAHQSLWATRMETGDMLSILSKLDQVGYWSIEMWGGATFDTCLRFLDENPWDRLRVVKQHCPNTPLQMLTRGQNLIGYHHYSRDIVNRFIKAAHRNGIDVFRVFDALNDIRNVIDSAEAVNECGAHFEGAISYTMSPVHTLDSYIEYASELKALGASPFASRIWRACSRRIARSAWSTPSIRRWVCRSRACLTWVAWPRPTTSRRPRLALRLSTPHPHRLPSATPSRLSR